MKNIFLLIIVSFATNLMAQKDTIYFDQHWQKTTKDKAKYYRLLPLEKVGNLYKVTDYYRNGNKQMEGFWNDVKKEIFEGETKWYFENGNLSEIITYENGIKQGVAKTYIKNGDLKTEGTYEKNKPLNGSFIAPCSDCDVSLYKNDKRIATYRYYKNSAIIAQKSTAPDVDDNYENFFYDRNGKEIGHATMQFYKEPVNGKMVYFNTDKDRQITIVENYAHFKNGVLEGEAVNYDNDGKIIAKGIYKDGIPYNGSFTNYIDNTIKTYKNGILNGKELFYSDKHKLVATGINKNGKHWSGQFYDAYYDNFHTIVNYIDGKLTGEQVSYYTTDFEKIAEISHIKNEKKDGEVIAYDKNGKQLAKGVYKDGKQWNGSFYDFYYHQLSTLKEGVKHGVFILYSNDGEIVSQREYKDGKLEGTVLSSGYFDDNKCKCIYKEGKPFNGEVCNDVRIETYKNGLLTKLVEYNDDLKNINTIIEYKDGKPSKETTFVKDKKYELRFKNGEKYDGVQYNSYNGAFYTFKKGLLEGPFSMTLYYSNIIVSGNYKNNKQHGLIKFVDNYLNKTTTCTYEYGKPINGTVLTEKGEKKYKNGLQYGKVIEIDNVYLYKNGERELVYNALEKEYKNGKIEGEVTYFIDDKMVNKNTYKEGKPFNGVFYQDGKFIANYKNGKKQTVIYNPHPYTTTAYYKKNEITKVEVTKENTEPYVGYYKSSEKDNGLFLNFDDDRFPTQYIITSYKNGLKNGLEKQIKINDDLTENTINTKTYKNGKLTKEIWHTYYVNPSQKVEGTYKNEKPHNGYFYAIDNNAFNIYQYKNGLKDGKQYTGYTKKLTFVKTDSIIYKNGKPFQGKEVIIKHNLKFAHQYENGKAINTEILDNNYYDNIKAIVTYSDNGIVTKTPSGKMIGELIYLNETKDKARVICYKDFKKVGTLEYDQDKITKIDLAFKEAGLDLKYYIDQQGKVTIKAKNITYSIIIQPSFEAGKNFDFTDFLEVDNLFVYTNPEASADFYLDEMAAPISHCTIKKGKPYNGTIIRYNEYDKTYRYKKYKNGERIKKERGLSRKQLIKILNNE